MSNEIKQGQFIDYFEDDTIQLVCHYVDGKLHGRHTMYFPNGNIDTYSNYSNDKLHGEYIKYYETGNVWYECTFTNGKKEGRFVSYYDTDKDPCIDIISNYVNGKLKGEYEKFAEDGSTVFKYTY
jgi:antitoxin component YwqK of YwqJK toxin-antitoxin module